MRRLTLALVPIALLSLAAKGGCGGEVTAPGIGPAPGGDAGCPSPGTCFEPDIPAGCHLGEPTCTNGVAECPQVVCPDAGATEADAGASTDSSTADVASPEAGPADAGGFTCDSGDGSPITCEARTQACKIVNGGVYPGIHAPTCVTLPPSCLSAPTCACVEAAASVSSSMCVDNGGNFTVTEDVP
jgi:hypothetical protein